MLVAFTLDSVSPAEHELRTGDRTLKVLDLAGNTTMGCTFPQRSVLNSASNVIHPEGDEFRSVAAFGIGAMLRLATHRHGALAPTRAMKAPSTSRKWRLSESMAPVVR